MTTQTNTIAVSTSATAGLAVTFLAGFVMIVVSGFAQATVLHDAAHDQRHAMAFPCH